jgi:hypothetical protein
MTITGAAPGRSSSAVSILPMTGATPSVPNKSPPTELILTVVVWSSMRAMAGQDPL